MTLFRPIILTRKLLAALAALTALALTLVVAAPARAEDWAANEDDALLLELHTAGYKLGDTLRGYQTPGGVCVDFADLLQALDLPVRLDKKSRRATGWLFAEDERFTLDRDAETVQNVNGNMRLSAGALRDTPEGWCVDLNALSTWFGVSFTADLSNLAIQLKSDRKLPFLQALERKSRAARLRAPRLAEFDLTQLPLARLPYRAWRTPSLDVQVETTWNRATGVAGRYEALASGEALGMSVSARLAGSLNDSPRSLRLRAFRNDPAGNLLGPAGATQIALGDVETQRAALTGESAFGRGAFITNRPLNRPGNFAATTLRGTLPAGWDAELYRNGVLRAYHGDRGDGRYEFADIELLFGENDFEVVLYGPQGQIRRERSSFPVGLESIPAGQTWYWAGAVESGRDLFMLGDPVGGAQRGWRWGVGVERGLSKRTTAGVGYQSLLLAGQRRDYLEGTLRQALGPVLLDLSAAQQFGGGRAWRGQALGKLGQVRFAAHAMWIDRDFESELANGLTRQALGGRINATLALGRWSLPLELGAEHASLRSGRSVTDWSLRTALRIRRLSLTAELTNRRTQGPGAASSDDGTRLALLANTAIGGVRLRGETRFRLTGTRRGFDSARAAAEATLGPSSTLRAGYDYDGSSRRGEFSLGYVHQFRRFALRGEGKFDNRGGRSVGLTLAFSVGPDPVDGGWRFSRERLAQEGQARIEVYRDENGDGMRQPDEAPVEGVAIEAGFRQSDRPTNAAGRAVIAGLRPDMPVLVSIDAGSLPDPLLQPKGQGVVVVPRPGVASLVQLPLAPTGEIEAVVLGPDGEPREGVSVDLLDGNGRPVRQAITDFDGYLLFDAVPYGTYRLRIGAASAAALGVRAELGDALRIDRSNASLRVGRLRMVADQAQRQIAAAP